MKKLLGILVMVLWCNTAQAEWTFVYTDIQDYYYDKEKIFVITKGSLGLRTEGYQISLGKYDCCIASLFIASIACSLSV